MAGLDLFLIMLTAIVAPMGFQFALTLLLPADTAEYVFDPLIIARKWLDAALVAGLAIYLAVRNRLPAATFGLTPRQPLQQLGWGLITLICVYIAFVASGAFMLLFVSLDPNALQDLHSRVRFARALPLDDWRLTAGLLAPVAIHEELLFRGLLLPYLRRVLGSWWSAVLVSSAVFAVLHIHQGLLAIPQIMVVGVVMAVFYIRCRSLPAMMLAHFLFDFCQFQLIRVLEPFIRDAFPPAS